MSDVQIRAVPSCNMSAGVMAPPILPVGVATQLLNPAMSISGSGGQWDMREKKSTSATSESLAEVTSNSSLGWPLQHAGPTFYSEVGCCVIKHKPAP